MENTTEYIEYFVQVCGLQILQKASFLPISAENLTFKFIQYHFII